MVYRISKNGFFLSCSGYPVCDALQAVDQQGKPTVREVSQHRCPVCGREMIKRRGRFGEFLGCSGYSMKKADGTPECSTIINLDKQGNPLPPKAKPVHTTVKCEKCGSAMLLRDSKRGPFLGCSSFPKCRAIRSVKKLEGEDLKTVEALLPQLEISVADAQQLGVKITGVPAPAANGKTGPVATDIDCEECGKPMVIRIGRRGRFLGCSGYPKCKSTGEIPAKLVEELGLNGNGGTAPQEAPAPEIETDLTVD
jgi:DNA topoisomerase-1